MELASLYTVPLSAVNGLSRLTKLTTSKAAGTADSIPKFSNRPMPFELNRTADSNSNQISKLRRSLPHSWQSADTRPLQRRTTHLSFVINRTQKDRLFHGCAKSTEWDKIEDSDWLVMIHADGNVETVKTWRITYRQHITHNYTTSEKHVSDDNFHDVHGSTVSQAKTVALNRRGTKMKPYFDDLYSTFSKNCAKGKGLGTCYSAAYMSRLKTSRALQSWKWQLINMS